MKHWTRAWIDYRGFWAEWLLARTLSVMDPRDRMYPVLCELVSAYCKEFHRNGVR